MGSLGVHDAALPHSFQNTSKKKQLSLLEDRTTGADSIPGLHLNTVQYRQCPPPQAKITYRVKLLNALRSHWNREETEALFLRAVNEIETDGAALFGGLIDPAIFARLITAYDNLLAELGNNTFMHSYVNLREYPSFVTGGDYIEAFTHPLLVALISYLMGGAVRIMDLRAKDSDPICINAQDNMLHVDNTPFKEEYKVLLNWRRHEVKGPSGQNFTFLPGTHKGNRDILVNEATGLPWSTEKDSLFVSDKAIDGLFAFQSTVGPRPRVVEVAYPSQPLTAVFPAGALVHHRYRTQDGDPRSCIIAAFHLASKHPGSLMNLPPSSKQNRHRNRSLVEFLVSRQDQNSTEEFLDIISHQSARVETKLEEIFRPSDPSTLIDLDMLCLSGARLEHWRSTVVSAPNVVETKLHRDIRLTPEVFNDDDTLHAALAEVMMYDKHGLLQLILYEDGREEMRKPARKRIGEMRVQDLSERLRPWVRMVTRSPLGFEDLPQLRSLHVLCDATAQLASHKVETTGDEVHQFELQSLVRLMLDVGEAITRCEGTETYLSTSLFLFWTAEYIHEYLDAVDKCILRPILDIFLRNYVASILLVDHVLRSGDKNA